MDFKFDGNYVLENERIRLRPLERDDFKFLAEFSRNEPDIWFYNSGGAEGEQNLQKYIDSAIAEKVSGTQYPFIVFDKKTMEYIGSTRFYLINFKTKTLELGYSWYGKKYQGKGVNASCKYLMLDFAFENLDMERVGFKANNQNKSSLNAMKSIGCKEEGILRNYSTDALGNRIDVAVLSITKEEWFGLVKADLKTKIASQ